MYYCQDMVHCTMYYMIEKSGLVFTYTAVWRRVRIRSLGRWGTNPAWANSHSEELKKAGCELIGSNKECDVWQGGKGWG